MPVTREDLLHQVFDLIKLRGKPLPSGGGRIARAALAALENP
jgi:hypothetical protein